MADDHGPALNTDRELYREPGDWRGDFYSDSIHVTKDGTIEDSTLAALVPWLRRPDATVTQQEKKP